MKRTFAVLGLAVTGVALTTTTANAATVYGDGTGFVGKGEVQSVFTMNNSAIQTVLNANPKAFTFSTSQGASQALTQALSQTATQDGSQSGTEHGTQLVSQSASQDVIQTLSCTKTNGNIDQRYRIGSRDGERSDTRTATRTTTRDAHRDGSRTGVRTGTRDGSLAGNLNADVAADARKTGQWTGWNLKGYKLGDPTFTATGTESFPVVDSLTGDYDFGPWSFEGSQWQPSGEFGNFGTYDLGSYYWSSVAWASDDFVAEPGNNDPDGICKEGANNVVPGSVKLTTEYGGLHEKDIVFAPPVPSSITPNETPVTPGKVHDGLVVSGDVTYGNVTATGTLKVFASLNNGTPRAIN